MNKLRALLVDDERLARARLKRLLSTHQNISVKGEARSVSEAAAFLSTKEVDVIFLDIEMPGGHGFELFDLWRGQASVVFVTAFESFALKAFDFNAIDYLLKPVKPERLSETIDRVSNQTQQRTPSSQRNTQGAISIPTKSGTRIIALSDIVCINSADDYTEIVDIRGRVELNSTTLSEWQVKLEELGFCRIHRQTLVNLRHIKSLERSGSAWSVHVARLEIPLPVGRRRIAHLRENIAGLAISC